MADNLKNRTRFSSTIEPTIYKNLQDYSEKSSVPISKIIDKAISLYLESVNFKPEKDC